MKQRNDLIRPVLPRTNWGQALPTMDHPHQRLSMKKVHLHCGLGFLDCEAWLLSPLDYIWMLHNARNCMTRFLFMEVGRGKALVT